MKVNQLILMIIMTFTFASNVSANKKVWDFKVFYGDKEIGKHVFAVEKNKSSSNVTIEANFDVSVFYIPVYYYRHKNSEIWKDDCLSSISSSTDDNGETFTVSGKAKDENFGIKAGQDYQEVSGCIKSFSYWDVDFLDSEELLNSQTGEMVDVEIEFVTTEKLMVRNKEISTRRYRIKSDEFNIELWYTEDDEWVALNSITKDGGELSYVIQ